MPTLGQLQGYPVVLPASSDMARAVSLITPSPPVADAGEIISQALRQFAGPVMVVMDRYQRRLYFTTDSAVRAAWLAALTGGTQRLVMRPDAGQTGNALTWLVESSDNWQATGIVQAVTEPQKPKRSAFSLFNYLLSQGYASFAWLDQSEARVGFADYSDPDAVRSAVSAETPEAAIEIQPYQQGNFS